MREHLRHAELDTHRGYSSTPSALRPSVATTMASADFSLRRWRRPFSHEARSPQVRTRSFPAQPLDLRHLALTTRASWNVAHSPCSAAPHIQFLSIGSRFRSTLPPHTRSPLCSCASLRLLWPTHGRTFTSKIAPMLGAQRKGRLAPALLVTAGLRQPVLLQPACAGPEKHAQCCDLP